MKWLFQALFFTIGLIANAQVLSTQRSVNWTLAGLRDTSTSGFQTIDMQSYGVVGDGLFPNDSILNEVVHSNTHNGLLLLFPAGSFLFNYTINLPSNVILKGQGFDNTLLKMNLNGTGHSINIQGSSNPNDTTSITHSVKKDSNSIRVLNPAILSVGDWIQIKQYDADLVSSSWAEHSVGQIIQVKDILGNRIELMSSLRMDFDTLRSPFVQKIVPVTNTGIECLKIVRLDSTPPEQSSAINFYYAVNCWVKGIESENCTYSHIQARNSSNLHISGSYLHHGFHYGSGGRAYGIMLHSTSNECLVENTIFEHLRHSMIVQSGANGNVFSYNYSIDPYWNIIPNNAAGDMVLHGNYPYANLFEQNIAQNIVIDNSHGSNGPFNTFFRNRAESYGIFFSASNSPNQNLIGNEIPNNTLPFNLVNYTIQGTGHFLHGNNNKGSIHPSGTDSLSDQTYAYAFKPNYISNAQWAGIGPPNALGVYSIPPYTRFYSTNIFSGICETSTMSIETSSSLEETLVIFPNPANTTLKIRSTTFISSLRVSNTKGLTMFYKKDFGHSGAIDISKWPNTHYLVRTNFSNGTSKVNLITKH